MEDELLNLWIDVSTAINNSRIVQTLPYNEAHICNHLFRISGQDHDTMTPTQLCNATGMAKSLMNRTLRSLEEKGLIRDAKMFYIQEMLSDYKDMITPGTYELNTAMSVEEMLVVISSNADSEETE